MLRKRAKKYTEAEDSQESVEAKPDAKKKGSKRKVMKDTLSDAFKFIMNKEIDERPFDEALPAAAQPARNDTILSKYKKKSRVLEEEKT